MENFRIGIFLLGWLNHLSINPKKNWKIKNIIKLKQLRAKARGSSKEQQNKTLENVSLRPQCSMENNQIHSGTQQK